MNRSTHAGRPRPVRRRAIAGGTLLALVLLSGCGSSSPEHGQTTAAAAAAPPGAPKTAPPTTTNSTSTTPAKHAEEPAPVEAYVKVTSPVVRAEGTLPSRYTCDGADLPLPLHWTGIPSGTRELMFDVVKLKPVNGHLYFDWAVTGLKPSSHGTDGVTLPSGAVVGANGAGRVGYRLCPPRGAKEVYVVVMFALNHKLPAHTGFDAAELRRAALRNAKYEGFLIFNYRRR